MGRDNSGSTDPIRTKIPPFDSSRLDESNGGIFVQIGSVNHELSHPKVTGQNFYFPRFFKNGLISHQLLNQIV